MIFIFSDLLSPLRTPNQVAAPALPQPSGKNSGIFGGRNSGIGFG
jgi:hypothetical protein